MRYDNYLISAEYPGVARRLLEEDIDGAPTLFLQGTAGDVKPRQVAVADGFRSGTFDDIEIVGAELAADVKRTMAAGLGPLDISVRSALKRFPLPFDPGWGGHSFRRYAAENEAAYRRAWAELWLDRIAEGEPVPVSKDLTLAIFELSPVLRFLGISGELLTDIGLMISRSFGGAGSLTFGYTNGSTGYIPDSAVLKEGGYEATETVFFSNDMPGPWRDDIDATILGAFEELKGMLG